MNHISVFLVVQDEAQHIERVLESVKDCDDIVIVDSGSTDETLTLARRYTSRIYHHDWQGMAQQKAYAMSLCRHDWVLNLDADEQLTPELKQQICDLAQSGEEIAGAAIPIREFFLNAPVDDRIKKHRHIRFFRKSRAHYGTEREHESNVIAGEVIELPGCINHFGEMSLTVKVDKINRYSSGRAADKVEKGEHSHVLKLLLIFPLMFFKSYVLRRNFLNGRRGFIGSMCNAFYAFLKEAKLYEQEHREK